MTVVDNSVVVDVLLARLRPDQLGSELLAAPHLIDTEFIHVLRRYNQRGLLTDSQADGLFTRFDELLIERYALGGLRRRVWQLRHNLTAYDASYVALAEQLGEPLLTTDARLAAAPGIRCAIEVL